ncbi:MAG: hypothetical protein HC850_14420 [Rhodomicrobium sp.]|nr:hypothetical protein [Rhodomicrobium sp.]
MRHIKPIEKAIAHPSERKTAYLDHRRRASKAALAALRVHMGARQKPGAGVTREEAQER